MEASSRAVRVISRARLLAALQWLRRFGTELLSSLNVAKNARSHCLLHGEPDSSEKARYAIDLCENSGIEVIGIGINLVKVSDYFKKHIVINDLK